MMNRTKELQAMLAAFLMTVLTTGGLWALFDGIAAREQAHYAAAIEAHARG
ncbi:MAG: hypothetical protein SNJ79_12235 [Sphingomonadaceae bacterium]